MRFASLPVALMALILLIAVPVGGAPSLQVGSSATYNVSVRVSFSPPFCGTRTYSGSQTDIIACPLTMANLQSIEVNGTLGWTTTGLTNTTAALNVTRDLATFFGNQTVPFFRNTGSFNESINLANRTISIMPFIMPEMDEALQSLPGMSNWTSTVNTISSTMWARHPIYTMWWVNGPLKLNETVPVLIFPTNVTRSTSLDLANIGTRTAWTLTYNLIRPSPQQDTPDAVPIPIGDNFLAAFSFNYDQQSDLLLSATMNIHLGFLEPLPYQPSPCVSSGTTACPASSDCTTFVQSGISIQATLTLAKTNLNLGQRLGSTDGNGSNPGSGPSSTSGGPGPGGTSTGSGPGTSSGPGTTGTGGSNPSPGGSPQSTATKPASGTPWLYWILAIIAVAVVVTSVVFARRRAGEDQAQAPATQPST